MKIEMEKALFIEEYINKLENQFMAYQEDLEYNSSTDCIIDLIVETIHVFKNELPALEDSVSFNQNSLERDVNIITGILKKYLIDNGYNKNQKPVSSLDRFWKSFFTYFENELPVNNILKEEYIHYDNWNNGTHYISINYDYQFNLHYGINYDPEMFTHINHVKMFIELAFSEWIRKNNRYEFTKNVNTIFRKFKLPYKLQKGKVVSSGFKTSHFDDKIINYTMLERKIQFAEEMILSNEVLDKKCALDYIVDSLQYLISIQNGEKVKEKYSSSASLICGNNNSKQYKVLYEEIVEIMKIANEFFDIRHNEYLNKAKEKREPVTNPLFIEYLYNRFYGMLYILKIKNNN